MHTVEIKFGVNWEEIPEVANIKKQEILHKKLSPADSTCHFEIIPDNDLFNKFRNIGTKNIPVRILKDGEPYFWGFVRNKFSFSKTQKLQPLKVEIVTASFLLKRNVKSFISLISSTVSEILVVVLLDAGIIDYDLPNITTVLPAFKATTEEEYHDIITDLLFEYGWTFYFDATGKLKTFKLIPNSLSTTKTFNGTNIRREIKQIKSEEEFEKVIVKYSTLVNINSATMFSDTTGAKTNFKCFIEIPPNSYMGNGENDSWFAELSHPIGEIFHIENPILDIIKDPDISVDTFELVNNRILLKIKNNSLLTKSIRKLDIRADVILLKEEINYSITGNNDSNKFEEYESKYIYTQSIANSLASVMLYFYKFSDFDYELESHIDYNLGDIVQVSEAGIGANKCVIVEKNTDESSKMIKYRLQAINEYTPSTCLNETVVGNTPVSPETIDSIIDSIGAGSSYFRLLTTANSIKVYPDGSVKPELVQFQSKRVQGTTTPEDYLGRFRIYIDGVLSYTSTEPESELNWIGDNILPSENLYPSDSLIPVQNFYSSSNDDVLEIRVELFDSSNTVILDKLNILMIKDVTFNQQKIEQKVLQEVPKYLGKYLNQVPVQYNRGDWFLVYGETDEPFERGIYRVATNLVFEKLTDDIALNGTYFLSALNDILQVVQDGFGVITNYGNITYLENLATNTLMVQYLLGVDAKFTGTVVGGDRFNQNGTIADENREGYILLPSGTIKASNVELSGHISVDTQFVRQGVFRYDRFYPLTF